MNAVQASTYSAASMLRATLTKSANNGTNTAAPTIAVITAAFNDNSSPRSNAR